MIKQVKDYIKVNNLFSPKDTVVLALSGGVDSFVLFDILRVLDYQFIVAHVNHNQRKESQEEYAYIKNLCAKLNIIFRAENYYHYGNNFHDESHKFRYAFFKRVCKEFHTNIICTAHHQDDNFETILLNIMSGSNLFGYSGISSKLLVNDVFITRPLLSVNKEKIMHYAKTNNINYFEDASNYLDDYKRNRLRHHIMPSIIKEQPNVLDKVNEYSAILNESFNFIRSISLSYLNKWNNKICVLEFNNLNIALRKDIICLLLENNKIKRSFNLINLIVKLMLSDKPQLELSLKSKWYFIKRYGEAFISSKSDKEKVNQELSFDKKTILPSGKVLYFTKKKPNNGANYISLCYNKIILPLFVRTRKDGDIIKMPYGNKKIKDLFIDLKIVKEKRDEILLICDVNNNILWVIGYAISKEIQSYKEKNELYLVYEE